MTPTSYLCAFFFLILYDSDVKVPKKKIFKALHWAYYRSAANPFLKLNTPLDAPNEHLLEAGSSQWMSFRRRVDEVARAAGALPVDSSS